MIMTTNAAPTMIAGLEPTLPTQWYRSNAVFRRGRFERGLRLNQCTELPLSLATPALNNCATSTASNT
jgi:hypothetical protein